MDDLDASEQCLIESSVAGSTDCPVITVIDGSTDHLPTGTGEVILQMPENDSGDGQPKYKYTNEHGETILVTLADPAISSQEISVGDAGDVQDSILVTTSNQEVAFDKSDQEKIDISQNWFTSRIDKKALQEHGHKWKQGQWSADENETLKQNITQYCQSKGIQDPNEIIFEMSKEMRKDFYRVVARGLDRPLFSVYRRVLRMYDQKNHIGKYTPQEIAKLKELRCQHGNDWATIGAALGRSAGSVRDRCRLMKDSCKYGTWQHEEELRLASAVYELSGAQIGEEVHHGLCWADVSAKVGSRTEKQCRAKWLNFLNWKQKGGADWSSPTDDMLLIDKIIGQNIADESELDWVELAKDWSCVRSPQWLRSKWWTLKRHVPDYATMPFHELIQALSLKIHTQGGKPLRSGKLLSGANADDQKYIPVRLAQLGPDGGTVTVNLLQHTVQLPDGSHAILSEDLPEYNLLHTMQSSSSLGSGTYFIAAPPASSADDGSPLISSTDHVIVQTLPYSEIPTIKSEASGQTSLNRGTVISPHQNPDEIILLEEDGDGNVQASSASCSESALDHPSADSLIQLSPLADPLLHPHTTDLSADS